MTNGGDHEWKAVRRLLAVRLDSLGDVLMTTPAISALKETLGCQVTLLTSPAGAAVGPHVPEIDETIVYEAPWMKATGSRKDGATDQAMIERLRGVDFDAAVIFTVYSQNPLPAAMMCYLAGIPLRLAHCRENPYQLLSDWVKEAEPEQVIRHEVRRQLDLVAAIRCETADPRLRFQVAPADREWIAELLSVHRIHLDRPLVVVHPGASAPSRRYPLEGFAEVIRYLDGEGVPVVLTGSADEVEWVEQVRQDSQSAAVSLAGRLSVGELGALVEASALLIANNTGPVHLAAAVGTPVVDLYALTNPQHTPWMVPHIALARDVPCRFCYKSVCPLGHHDCLRGVEPEWVAAAAKTLLMNADPEGFYRSVPEGVLFREFPGEKPVAVQSGMG